MGQIVRDCHVDDGGGFVVYVCCIRIESIEVNAMQLYMLASCVPMCQSKTLPTMGKRVQEEIALTNTTLKTALQQELP